MKSKVDSDDVQPVGTLIMDFRLLMNRDKKKLGKLSMDELDAFLKTIIDITIDTWVHSAPEEILRSIELDNLL